MMTTTLPTSRTALVTGAASPRGIGRATAARLAAQGWNLAILDLDDGAAAETAGGIADKHGVQAIGVGADISDVASVHAAVTRIEQQLPPVVGLANIAGISSPTPYLELGHDEWLRQIAVNLTGVHIVTQRVARHMVKYGVGRIVSVSSISAQRGGGTFSKTPYSTAKAGLLGFTRSIARELGPHGITANLVSPGPIDTDIMGGPLDDTRKAAFIEQQVIPRVGTPTDVAVAITFLMGPDTGFITGENINVNGGHYMN